MRKRLMDTIQPTPAKSHPQTSGSTGPSISPTFGGEAAGPKIGTTFAKTASIRICSSENETDCNFWVGISQEGDQSPEKLLNFKDAKFVFEEAIAPGLNETGPILLTDTHSTPTRYIYLLPKPIGEFREQALWVGKATQAIKTWKPESAGFLISKAVLETPEANELLLHVLRDLIQNTNTTNFYLMVGEHSPSSILNGALQLKAEFESEKINLMIFH